MPTLSDVRLCSFYNKTNLNPFPFIIYIMHALSKFLFMCLAAVSVNPLVKSAAPALVEGRIVLTAEDSAKGKIIRAKGGKLIGVTLDRSCESNFDKARNAHIEWVPGRPLPAGWWHGVIESNFTGGYVNRDISIQLTGGLKPSVYVASNYLHVAKGEPQRFEFWIHSAAPSESVRIVPRGDLWRWNRTWPISRITLEQVTPASLPASAAITLELPVSTDGAVALPFSLPTGNWTLGGYMGKAGEAVVQGEEGLPIPLSLELDRWKKKRVYSTPFHIRSPLKDVQIVTKNLFSSVLLKHKATRESKPYPSEGTLMVTVDPAKSESETLVLYGTGEAGPLPAFPQVPLGYKNVVLTSWDDGKPTDLRCAQILVKHGYRPTFLLNGSSPALAFMDKLEAMGAEVGSHAYTHTALGTLSPRRALENAASMRLLLENKLGHPVISFSYPDGYSPAQDEEGDYVFRAVRDAGYWIARTQITREQTVADVEEPLLMRSIGLYGSGNKMLVAAWPRFREKEAGVFYLKGHSWQIGKSDAQWDKFEKFVAQFANNPGSWYPTNGEFALWLWAQKNIKISGKTRGADSMVVQLERPWLHPWLAARCPLSLKMPAGVHSVKWRGQILPVVDGRVDLVWAE
ncbi:polysaccharide deacetylase family protein [Kiritimatiellaeota bacterium B1221]|nr:polysaccharide deacetylase family protein [Kiritimatiellaeota bacterium B1221]